MSSTRLSRSACCCRCGSRPGSALTSCGCGSVPDEPWFTGDDPASPTASWSCCGGTATPARPRTRSAPWLPPSADPAPCTWSGPASTAPRARRAGAAADRALPGPAAGLAGPRRGAPAQVATLTVDHDGLLADLPDPDDPDDRRWWEDFDEAVRIGLAARIDCPATLPTSTPCTSPGSGRRLRRRPPRRPAERAGSGCSRPAYRPTGGRCTGRVARPATRTTWLAVLAGAANDTERRSPGAHRRRGRCSARSPDRTNRTGPGRPRSSRRCGRRCGAMPPTTSGPSPPAGSIAAPTVGGRARCSRRVRSRRCGSAAQPYGLLPTTALAPLAAADGDPRAGGALVRGAAAAARSCGATPPELAAPWSGRREEQVMDLVGALPTSELLPPPARLAARDVVAGRRDHWAGLRDMAGVRRSAGRPNFSRVGDVQLTPARGTPPGTPPAGSTMPLVVPAGPTSTVPTARQARRLAQQAARPTSPTSHQVENRRPRAGGQQPAAAAARSGRCRCDRRRRAGAGPATVRAPEPIIRPAERSRLGSRPGSPR